MQQLHVKVSKFSLFSLGWFCFLRSVLFILEFLVVV